jgi:hypothetical protein
VLVGMRRTNYVQDAFQCLVPSSVDALPIFEKFQNLLS